MRLFAPKRLTFPDPRQALSGGIVDVSDNVSNERLLEAYSYGIFPWPQEGMPVLWFSPEPRGVLDFEDFHVSRSLQKFCRKTDFTVTFNHSFERVIEACAKSPRPLQEGTWITPKLLSAYVEFHRAGYVHSLEVWSGAELVGGLYGVYVGGVFCGESMFFLQPNASKFAFVKLVEFLRGQGLGWMDIQMVTPVLEAFGGKYIARADFLKRLEQAKLRARSISFV